MLLALSLPEASARVYMMSWLRTLRTTRASHVLTSSTLPLRPCSISIFLISASQRHISKIMSESLAAFRSNRSNDLKQLAEEHLQHE